MEFWRLQLSRFYAIGRRVLPKGIAVYPTQWRRWKPMLTHRLMPAYNQSAQHCPLCAASYHATMAAISKEDAFELAAKHVARTLEGVEAIIEYKFKNSLLLWEALQAHGSAVKSIGAKPIPEGNMRLAILGDSIMRVALVDDWYRGAEDRKYFSTSFEQTASNANLEKIGRAIGLQAFIYAEAGSRSDIRKPVMSATVEAIIGAVYLDSDIQSVKAVMRTIGLRSPKLVVP